MPHALPDLGPEFLSEQEEIEKIVSNYETLFAYWVNPFYS
jgi:hypothetical protein